MTLAQSREELQVGPGSRLRGSVRGSLVCGILVAVLALQSLVTVHPIGHGLADSLRPCALCAATHLAPMSQSCPETPGVALVPVDCPQPACFRYTASLVPTRSARAPPIAG